MMGIQLNDIEKFIASLEHHTTQKNLKQLRVFCVYLCAKNC